MAPSILRTLTLKGFRSVPWTSIKFDNPTILVGPNGAGKSNVADAFAFLSDAMVFPLETVFHHRGGAAAVLNRQSAKRKSSNIGFTVVLEGLGVQQSHAQYAFEMGVRSHGNIEVLREQCVMYNQGEEPNWFDRDVNGYFRTNAESLHPVLHSSTLALPLIGGNHLFRLVPNFLKQMRTYRIDLHSLRSQEQPRVGDILHSDGGNMASVLRNIRETSSTGWTMVLKFMKSIVPNMININIENRDRGLSLEFIQRVTESEDETFNAAEVSDGTLRALGLLASVFQTSSPSVLVIEEPELSIHQASIGVVIDLLRHAGRYMQAVVTTHSADVLDADWIEHRHLRIVSCHAGATLVNPASETSRKALEEGLMGAGELLRSNALASEGGFAECAPFESSLFLEGLE